MVERNFVNFKQNKKINMIISNMVIDNFRILTYVSLFLLMKHKFYFYVQFECLSVVEILTQN